MTTSAHVYPHTLLGRLAARGGPVPIAVAVISAAVIATIVDVVIAAVAHAAGVSDDFRPLQFPAYASLTVIGILVGALCWSAVVRRSNDPSAVLRKLVPLVVIISFVPDIVLGVAKSQAHTSWGGIVALMLMHLTAAGAAVPAFITLLPPRARRDYSTA